MYDVRYQCSTGNPMFKLHSLSFTEDKNLTLKVSVSTPDSEADHIYTFANEPLGIELRNAFFALKKCAIDLSCLEETQADMCDLTSISFSPPVEVPAGNLEKFNLTMVADWIIKALVEVLERQNKSRQDWTLTTTGDASKRSTLSSGDEVINFPFTNFPLPLVELNVMGKVIRLPHEEL